MQTGCIIRQPVVHRREIPLQHQILLAGISHLLSINVLVERWALPRSRMLPTCTRVPVRRLLVPVAVSESLIGSLFLRVCRESYFYWQPQAGQHPVNVKVTAQSSLCARGTVVCS